MLYYLNSGLFRFHELDRLPSAHAKQNLIAEIQTEPPTQEEVHKILRQFFEHRAMYPQQNFPSESFKLGKILACGLCGISLPEQNNWSYKRMSLSDLDGITKLSESEAQEHMKSLQISTTVLIDENNTPKKVFPFCCLSIYRSLLKHGDFHHLHPELVEMTDDKSDEYTYVCSFCQPSVNIFEKPPLSIAKGIDFGNFERIGLVQPNVLELNILSNFRMYHSIIKFQNNQKSGARSNFTGQKIRSHVILFPHNCPKIACAALFICNKVMDPQSNKLDKVLDDLIQFEFICGKDQMDFMMKQTLQTTTLVARAHVLYQWLVCLRIINPYYQDILALPTFGQFQDVVVYVNNTLNKKSFQISNPQSLKFEAALGDDIAQQSTCANGSEEADCCSMDISEDDIPSAYYLVHSPDERDKKSVKFRSQQTIKTIADMFDVNLRQDIQNKLPVPSTREDAPISMYEDNNFLLANAFPTIFLLGKTYSDKPIKGPLTQHQTFHLLTQGTHFAAQCKELYFLL